MIFIHDIIYNKFNFIVVDQYIDEIVNTAYKVENKEEISILTNTIGLWHVHFKRKCDCWLKNETCFCNE